MNHAENENPRTVTPYQVSRVSSSAADQHARRRGRWTLLALALAVFFSMGHFAGAYQKEKEEQQLKAKTIISEKFEIRGPDNTLRASLTRGREGEVYLLFFDKAHHTRLTVGLDAQGSPSISFFDEQIAHRMSLALDSENGTPQIIL